MPSYHSVFNKLEVQKFCGIPSLDFKKDKTPSLDPTKLSTAINDNQLDIIDEGLIYFRANVLFKNFNIEGDADKLLVYIIVFIQKCLEKGNDPDEKKAKENMNKLISTCEWIPQSENFFNILADPKDKSNVGNLQKYLKEIRQEVVKRLIYILFDNPSTAMDRKFWLGLGKKKFMGYDMLSTK
jgi:actin related protein 2/3 complex subunit 3